MTVGGGRAQILSSIVQVSSAKSESSTGITKGSWPKIETCLAEMMGKRLELLELNLHLDWASHRYDPLANT